MGRSAQRATRRAGGRSRPALWEVARLRQGSYRFLAALLLYPTPARVAPLQEAARLLREHSSWAAQLGFYGPWASLLGKVAAFTPESASDLALSYHRLFLENDGVAPIPLWESAYGNPLDTAAVEADLLGTYRAGGLDLLPGGAAPDHVSVQLEFASFLCGQEAEAWEARQRSAAVDALERQGHFLRRHPVRWLSVLVAQTAVRDSEGFYSGVLQAAWALVAHDADFAQALAAEVSKEGEC